MSGSRRRGGGASHQPQGKRKDGSDNTCSKDCCNRSDLPLTDRKESSCEEQKFDYMEVFQCNVRQSAMKHAKQKNGKSGIGDQGDHGRAQGSENLLDTAEIAVLIIEVSQCQTNDEGRSQIL